MTIESVQKGDRLAVNTAGTPLRAEYDPHSGVLTLSGGAELADYQQVMRTLGYSSQADIVALELRVLSLTLTNGSGAYQVDLTPFSLEPSILSGTALGDRLRGTPADDELRGLADNDRLDLSALNADTQRPGDQPFSYIGDGEFSAAGQLRYVYDADSRWSLLAADTDGDGGTDFEIGLLGVPTLSAETLVL